MSEIRGRSELKRKFLCPGKLSPAKTENEKLHNTGCCCLGKQREIKRQR